MVAALAAVPFLLHYLGQERLGVLSLVWVVIGYFSFLDMGLGRAVTVAVASCRADGVSGRKSDHGELAHYDWIIGTYRSDPSHCPLFKTCPYPTRRRCGRSEWFDLHQRTASFG